MCGPAARYSIAVSRRCGDVTLIRRDGRQAPLPLEHLPLRQTQVNAASQMRFSVIIPTFKRAQLLGDAIRAALAQTHTNRGILVVDDGSLTTPEVSHRHLEKRYATFVSRIKENRPPSVSAFRRVQETPPSYWMTMITSRRGPLPSIPRRWREMLPRIFLCRFVRLRGDQPPYIFPPRG
jgi:Glycosyl transferase family 2